MIFTAGKVRGKTIGASGSYDLIYAGDNNRGVTIPDAELAMFPSRTCGEIQCPTTGNAQHSYRVFPQTVPVLAGTDLYHITVQITGPTLYGCSGACRLVHDIFGNPKWTCFGESLDDDGLGWTAEESDYDYAEYHGSVGGGSYLDDTGAAITTEFDALPDVRGTRRFWPDRYDGSTSETSLMPGYLVNPNPTWPVPDDSGNTFGRCLFTAGQIPAAIDFVLTHNNRDADSGGFVVTVGAYFVHKVIRGTTLVGPGLGGIRRRKRIVGQGGAPLRIG